MDFDNFTSYEKALKFAKAVRRQYQLDYAVLTNASWANDIDPVPFGMKPPVVLIARIVDDHNHILFEKEEGIISLVKKYGGQFAGT